MPVSEHSPLAVGDEVFAFGRRRRVIAVLERTYRDGESVCLDVSDMNVWGGWVWVPYEPGPMSPRRVTADAS